METTRLRQVLSSDLSVLGTTKFMEASQCVFELVSSGRDLLCLRACCDAFAQKCDTAQANIAQAMSTKDWLVKHPIIANKDVNSLIADIGE